MTINRTTLLDLPLPVTGTESGTWGDTTNNGLTQYMDIAIAGMSNLTSANFTAGALTIETTEGTNSATNIVATSAQYAGFRVTSLAQNSTITVGNTGTSPARSYRLINADATYTLTFKATGQTGVTLLPGQSAVVAFNGTDYVIVGMVGAGTATDNAVARFDGTTGEIVQNSVVIVDDTGGVTGVTQLDVDNLRLDSNTISSTDTNGNIVLAPNGTGDVQLDADTVRVGDSGAAATITTNGAGNLTLSTNAGTNSGTIVINQGTNGDIALTPNGTGEVDITKVNIDGGTIDGTAIGGASASTGAFTTLSASSTVTLSGGTANGVLYLNGSKVATSGAALTFDGTTLGVSSGSSTPALKLYGAAVSQGQLQFSSTSGYVIQGGPDYTGLVYNVGSASYQHIFQINGSEQMRLTSTGLGIGTSTPNAGAKLTVAGGILATSSFSSTSGSTAGIDYDSGSLRLFAVGTSGATKGAYSFIAKGADGSSSTPMTLDASGNLLVGKTSGSGSRFEVSGNASGAYIAELVENTNSGGYASTNYSIGSAGASGIAAINYAPGIFFAIGPTSNDTTTPIVFRNNNATERARITSGGDLQISSGGSFQVGGTAARATTAGTNRIDIFNGTAPVGTLTNGISLYSSSGEAYVMDAAGNATLFSPHDAETNEWVFKSKHTPTGKVLKIDVEKLLRFVNDHFGLDAVHEFIES